MQCCPPLPLRGEHRVYRLGWVLGSKYFFRSNIRHLMILTVWERIQKLESVDLLQGVLRAMEATAGFQGHVGEVLSLAASDAGMLLSGAEDGARLWSVKVGVSSHPCAIKHSSSSASSCPNFWEILFVLTTAGCTTTRARGLLCVWGSCRRVSRTEAASRSCTLARILQQTMPK